MKKILLAIGLAVAVLAVTIVGMSIAYFTDTDQETNVFTVGGVKVELIEQQRNADSTALVPFEQNKVLMPIVGSAQGEQETVGGVTLPTAENYVDKIMTIKNTGKSDAYVRIFVAVPTALQNGQTPNAPRYDVLHWNFNGDSCEEGQWTDEIVVANPVLIDGVEYKIYSRTYTTALAATEVTATPAYIGFYLDKTVDMHLDENGVPVYTVVWPNIGTEIIDYDLSKGVNIPVFVQAVQATGFENAEAAFAASGLPANPWA